MFVTGLTEHFFRKKFCDSQASKMKKKWVYKNCVTENFFSIFIFFSVTLNGHVRQKNEVYKNDCDWALLSLFFIFFSVTLNGLVYKKNGVYKNFCHFWFFTIFLKNPGKKDYKKAPFSHKFWNYFIFDLLHLP